MDPISDLLTKKLEHLESKLKRLQVVAGVLSALMVGIVVFHWTHFPKATADLVAESLTIVDAQGEPWFVVSSDDATGNRELVLRDAAGRRRATLGVISKHQLSGSDLAAGTVALGLFSAQDTTEGDGLSAASLAVGPTGSPGLSLSSRNLKARFGAEVSPDFGGAALIGTDMEGRRTLLLPEFGKPSQ